MFTRSENTIAWFDRPPSSDPNQHLTRPASLLVLLR